jgi:hypothetical protein
MIYPNSTPEFRIYKTINGDAILQIRYVNVAQAYKSKWQAVPVIEEEQNKLEIQNKIKVK